MRAPASRISFTCSSWRGRSSMITITSPTSTPFSFAIALTISPSGRSMSSTCASDGEVAIFSM